jgi:hypothetical protein
MYIVVLTVNGASSTSKSLQLQIRRVIRYFVDTFAFLGASNVPSVAPNLYETTHWCY